jgi:hypothetical protein
MLIDIVFVMNFFSGDLFRAAPYKLVLVLHKGALFHLQQNFGFNVHIAFLNTAETSFFIYLKYKI